MSEYEKLGHMEEVIEIEKPMIVFYFPHHDIYRLDKSTMKLRVVFNGSRLTPTGECLNSYNLMEAPFKMTYFQLFGDFEIIFLYL